MTINEIKILEQSIDQFISINSFFFTSTKYEEALEFLKRSATLKDSERVFFETDADPKMATTKPFADISQFSETPGESEILFMIGSTFRLKDINRNDEHDLKEVLVHMKQQIGSEETNFRTLGKILWKMGKLDLAEKYFNRLLKELQPNDHLRIKLYKDLDELTSQTGDFDMSVQWLKKSARI